MDRASDAMMWIFGVLTVVVLLIGGLLGWPKYTVYRAEHAGRAALAQAENERQVLVEQARAERDAAAMRKEAIELIGQAAKDFPEYRQQEFIGAFAEALEKGHVGQIIYVPTEASIPITEAGRIVAPGSG